MTIEHIDPELTEFKLYDIVRRAGVAETLIVTEINLVGSGDVMLSLQEPDDLFGEPPVVALGFEIELIERPVQWSFDRDPDSKLLTLGYLGCWLIESDPHKAAEQIDEHYQHGGGWHPLKGWEIVGGSSVFDSPLGTPLNALTIQYPGDGPITSYASAQLRDETIYMFPGAWVLVLQKVGSFECARVD